MNVLAVEYAFVLCGLFILGSVFGSMLNVCIYRLPREENLWLALKGMFYPPSHCPRCKRPIRPIDNIPIWGWIKLGGRCRNCRGKISIRYPAIEALTGFLFAILYAREVPSLWGWVALQNSSIWHLYGPANLIDPEILANGRYALHAVLIIALVVATFIDLDLRIIPDSVTLPAMALALIAHAARGDLYIVPLWYQTPKMAGVAWQFFLPIRDLFPPNSSLANWPHFVGVPGWLVAHPHWHGFFISLAGIIVGGASIWAVRLAGHWALGREAMGFGDVVLMAAIGSFVGWQATLIVFVLALGVAVTVAIPQWLVRRDRELPYGPYLAVGTFILLLFGRQLFTWFEDRFLAMGPLLLPAGLVMMVSLGLMLVGWRKLQKALGIAKPDLEWVEETQWLAGDQLAYLANQTFDDRQGQWRRPEWEGNRSGRGQAAYNAWKNGR